MLTFSILILCLVSYFTYDRINHRFRQLYPYSEELDTLTQMLLKRAESVEYKLTLGEHTIKVECSINPDFKEYLWIANYPFAYGQYYSLREDLGKYSVSYETFRRTRVLHLKLLAEKKALEEKQRKEYIESKIKQLSGE